MVEVRRQMRTPQGQGMTPCSASGGADSSRPRRTTAGTLGGVGALEFWKAVVEDRSNFLERVVEMLDKQGIRYCVIGGVGVNAYSEPIVTQDLDIVVATEQIEEARRLLEAEFTVREFEHSLNVYDPGSKLQVQVQLDEGLGEAVGRATTREVMDLHLPIADPRDLMRMKIAAATDPKRRGSKRAKDILDIARLVMAFPELRSEIPETIRVRVEEAMD
jgi:hypothetical protein